MGTLNLENKKVLVVEDDDMSFLYLNHIFLLTGANVVRKKTGIDAIEAFRNDPDFEFVLMDIQLPDMDGVQVTREIRKLGTAVPIIAQTASRSGEERELMVEAGCSSVLTKPFSMEQLFETMEKYI